MAAQSLPVIRIENTGAAQADVPFTFGQVFKVGHLKPGQGLGARTPSGEIIALQVDEKATHADGSVRHAIISGILPTLFTKEERELALVPAKAGTSKEVTGPLKLVGTARVVLVLESQEYTADFVPTKDAKWIDGPIVSEWPSTAPLVDGKGTPHPHLQVRLAQRCYWGERTRLEVIVENTKTFAPGARNYTYDVAVKFAGKTVFEQKALTHYHHARWRKVFWLSDEPQIHIKHDTDYLIDTRAVPNYDRNTGVGEAQLASYAANLKPEMKVPMAIGALTKSMGTTGGRPDIGPLPAWAVMYLLTMDKRAMASMLAIAEGAGSWSIHYRDEETGYPVRADSEKNKNLSTHMNLAHKGPLPVPRFEKGAPSSTPYAHDTAHQPSMVYVPYLVTGEYYYLEELHFWAAANSLETDPANSGNGKGLVRWQQVRGQAWSLRTLGHAAYITPDGHPLKDYFVKQLDNNLDFYHAAYVTGNPNQLGVYDGSGAGAFAVSASAPWQDDFLTWSFGYLAELGFSKAQPILQWKAKYPVGRMTAPGFCPVQASTYDMKFKPDAKSPIFGTFEELYKANFGGDKIWVEGKTAGHPKGLKYIEQPCGSKAQADWLGAVAGYGWEPSRMIGYADSPIGYPSNMQPALAVAATLGAPGAKAAWDKFDARAVKPDYRKGPQFAIVPRPEEAAQQEPEDPDHEKPSAVIRSVKGINGELYLKDPIIQDGKLYTVVVLEE